MPELKWPLFGLTITTPRLELRVHREDDLPVLIGAAHSGIHDPGFMPFGVPWTDAESPEFEREFHRHYWRVKAEFSPTKWSLPFMVSVDGETIGVQDLRADDFPTRRAVWSGSWLRQDRQGQGIGKEMRFAILVLAFDHLGADLATSESLVGNESSMRVSQALGYEEDGHGRWAPRGEPLDSIRWRLTLEQFEQLRSNGHYATYEPVQVEGLTNACRILLGAEPPSS
ncbi:MAG: GNAT family N-acetyltransferase [Actinobacteria bacterium]|nr:GNAT family N-acetyltransferase [Actinomycetota bacterium]